MSRTRAADNCRKRKTREPIFCGGWKMNIGFVGVGRMGANMARRLKDRGDHVTTAFDVNRAAATSLATELGCAACPTLGDVTAGAGIIFTVGTDDAAMRT